MSRDLYIELGGKTREDIDALVKGTNHDIRVPDIATRIRLLGAVAAQNDHFKDYAASGDRKRGGGYKSLIHHARNPKQTPFAKELIQREQARLERLALLKPEVSLAKLPIGSWFLQFTFTLAKPWISKDDEPFYVAESVNPVRKDKVFKVPFMSATSWKGLLRWTMMHTRLALSKDRLEANQFADERFRQTLLFGDEAGEESGGRKHFAGYLDKLGGKEGRKLYFQIVREFFTLDEKDAMPHHTGRLVFHPTFFDLVDLEVINPHSRKTKSGTFPIYLECVPAGAEGTFSLLYIPFDQIGQNEQEIHQQAAQDLQVIAEAIIAMMLTYGFSAKRTSGYGVAGDRLPEEGMVKTRSGKWKLAHLTRFAEEVANVEF